MRALILGAVLAALAAGCLTSTDPAPDPTSNALAGWLLDCTLGSYETTPWEQRCVARASHTPGPKQEIWLAVNPTDADNVILGSKDNNPESSMKCVWNGLAVTHDGGQTWKDVTIGGKYADRRPTDPYYGYACNTDPMLAFSADGTAHYVVEMYNFLGQDGFGPLTDPSTGRGVVQPGWKLLLATSRDGGDTWPQVVTLEYGDGALALNDYSRIAVSPTTGTILVAINTFQGVSEYNGIPPSPPQYEVCSLIASRDGGRTADRPVFLTDRDNPGEVPCYGLAVSPLGAFVVGTAGTFGGAQSYWSRSTDDGRTFSDPHPGFAINPTPSRFNETKARTGQNFDIFYDRTDGPRKGTLYAVYADDSRGDSDVYLRSSRDHGVTWADAVRINTDDGHHHQWLPNGVVARDGSVHAVFMDKRWDPANRLIDITHAVSADGGATWLNERVTTKSFDGDLGQHQENFPFIGDYIGIGTTADVVWMGFPDATTGTTVIAAARSVLRA